MKPKMKVTKEKKKKTDELNFIKIKNKCFKAAIKKVKRQPTRWEKILAHHISDEVWCPAYTKNFHHSTVKKTTQPNNGRIRKSHLSKADPQMASKRREG